jgi:hypothetical protein
MKTTTRRAVIAGAAALPALAVPAMAMPPAGADPIFAAIERHRKIEAAFAASGKASGNCSGELCDKSSDAYVALVKMTPVTLAGCAALLRHLEAHERSYGRVALLNNHNHAKIPARDLLSRIAAMLDAAVQS